MHCIRRLILSLIISLGLVLSLTPLSAQAADNFTDADVRQCVEANNVFVIVDFGDYQKGGCATEFATGLQAFKSAGFTADSDSFVTVIDGVRASWTLDKKWWTYWHKSYDAATGCSAWEFSQLGYASYAPKPGSIEGWAMSPTNGTVSPTWDCFAGQPPLELSVTAAHAGAKPAGQATNVWGAVAQGAGAAVSTEVKIGNNWSTSQRTVADDAGRYVLPLSYGTNTPGSYTFRVRAEKDGVVAFSSEFTLERYASVTAQSASIKGAGEATNTWGTVAGGANSRVWTQVQLGGNWSTSQVGTTDANGRFVLPLTYGQNSAGTQTFRVGVSVGGVPVYSEPFTITRFSVTAASAGSKPVGQATNAWGVVAGAPGATVKTEVLIGGRWAVSQVATADANGRYVLPLTYGSSVPGTYTYRVVAEHGGGRTVSAPFTLLRTA